MVQWLFVALVVGGLAASLDAQSTAPATQPADVGLLGSADFLPTPQHPVGYRGDGSSRYPGATNPCLTWWQHGVRPAPDVHILWQTLLGGFTQSHPIVVGNKVITLEEPDNVVCVDADTGKLLWRRQCDVLTLFSPAEQTRARQLIQYVQDNYFRIYDLHWEYLWLTGAWHYDLPGFRPRKGNIDSTPATADRIAAIAKEWKDSGFQGTPADMGNGHGIYPFAFGTPAYRQLVSVMADLQVDFGICPQVMCTCTQMVQRGDTQGTPTSDGTDIYAVFGYGQVACLDLDGNIKWMKWFAHDLDKAKIIAASGKNSWIAYMRKGLTGPSPLLIGDKLIITQGYAIRALDKTTGNTLWQVKYGNGNEADDGRIGYRGPIELTLDDGTPVLICPQGYIIRISDGKVLDSDPPMNMFMVPIGNAHCYVMGLSSNGGNICYFTWADGVGAVRVVKAGANRAETRFLWLAQIPDMVAPLAAARAGFPHGSVSAETLIDGNPVFDPDRHLIYVAPDLRSSLWSFNSDNGAVVDHYQVPGDLRFIARNECWGESGCSMLTDPIIVGRKYIFMQSDLGACYVFDADNIHHVLAANTLMCQVHRDLAEWDKPWSEIKKETVDRYLYYHELYLSNDSHRTPGDLFIQGDKIFIRTVEGLTCISDSPNNRGR